MSALDRAQVVYEQPLYESEKGHHLWYGGDVAHIDTIHNGQTIRLTLSANGDVIGDYYDKDCNHLEYVRDKQNLGEFYGAMRNHIPNDTILQRLLLPQTNQPIDEYGILTMVDTNWWEVFISNQHTGEAITSYVLDATTYVDAITEMLENMQAWLNAITA